MPKADSSLNFGGKIGCLTYILAVVVAIVGIAFHLSPLVAAISGVLSSLWLFSFCCFVRFARFVANVRTTLRFRSIVHEGSDGPPSRRS